MLGIGDLMNQNTKKNSKMNLIIRLEDEMKGVLLEITCQATIVPSTRITKEMIEEFLYKMNG